MPHRGHVLKRLDHLKGQIIRQVLIVIVEK